MIYLFRMRIHEKIKYLRKESGLSIRDLHEKIKSVFGDQALSYDSLSRIEKGYRSSLRLNTLYQISTALDISLKELKEGTEEQESSVASIMRRKDRQDKKFIYNEKAYALVMSPKELEFLVMVLTLEPKGKTQLEQDPIEDKVYKKLVIVDQGIVEVHIGKELHTLKKGDSLSFKSSLPHYFENPTKAKARCTIVQNPKSY